MKKKFSITLKLQLMLMQVFFFSSQSTTNMTLRFVNVQHFSGLFCKSRINVQQPLSYVFMNCRFADTKFFCRLPHGSFFFNNILPDCDSPLFNIFFHGNAPERFFTSYETGKKYILESLCFTKNWCKAISSFGTSFLSCISDFSFITVSNHSKTKPLPAYLV